VVVEALDVAIGVDDREVHLGHGRAFEELRERASVGMIGLRAENLEEESTIVDVPRQLQRAHAFDRFHLRVGLGTRAELFGDVVGIHAEILVDS